jgi:hypothetical protein
MIEPNPQYELHENQSHASGHDKQPWLRAEQQEQEWLRAERDEQEWLRTQHEMLTRQR